MKQNRGFSLLATMLVMIVMAIVGVTTLALSNSEAGTAGARSMRRQALTAAEAGLNHFIGNAPAVVVPDAWYVGNATEFLDLPPIKDARGQELQPRYRVRTIAGAGPVADSVVAVAEGQVVQGTNVIGQATLSAIVISRAATGSGNTGQGQKSLGAWGTSSNMPARSDISLVDFPEGD